MRTVMTNHAVSTAFHRTQAWATQPSVVAFLAAFVLAFLLSKVLGFVPGFSLDDYVTGQPSAASGVTEQFIVQGRFTFALLHEIFGRAHLQQSDFAAIGLFALALFSGLFYGRAFGPDGQVRLGLWLGLGLLLGAHSYFAEYVTFRQAIIPMALTMGLNWISLDAYLAWREEGGRARLMTALASAVLAAGTNQLAVSFLSIGVLFFELRGAAEDTSMKHMGIRVAMGFFRAAASSMVLVAFYFLVLIAVQWWTGIHGADDRTTLLALSAVPGRLREVSELLIRVAFGDELIASQMAKGGLWFAFATMFLATLVRRPLQIIVALAFFVAAVCLALLPVVIGSVWWPVPRTLIAVPMAVAGTIVLLSLHANARLQGLSAIALGMSAVMFAGHSTSVLNDQQRLNRWDQTKARDIADHVTRQFPALHKIALSGASWAYPIAPDMAQGDMNVSALSIGWAVDAVFDEATGVDMSVRVTDEKIACASRPRFPLPESTFQAGDEVVVCL